MYCLTNMKRFKEILFADSGTVHDVRGGEAWNETTGKVLADHRDLVIKAVETRGQKRPAGFLATDRQLRRPCLCLPIGAMDLETRTEVVPLGCDSPIAPSERKV